MMSDIVGLIRAEHEKVRECLSTLSRTGRDTAGLQAAALATWYRLVALLDLHSQAEQEIVHPALWRAAPEFTTSVLAAAADHVDIREVVQETSLQPVGSPAWWQTLDALRLLATRHLAWDEQVLLPALCHGTSSAARRKLARQWTAFTGARAADALGRLCPRGAGGDAADHGGRPADRQARSGRHDQWYRPQLPGPSAQPLVPRHRLTAGEHREEGERGGQPRVGPAYLLANLMQFTPFPQGKAHCAARNAA